MNLSIKWLDDWTSGKYYNPPSEILNLKMIYKNELYRGLSMDALPQDNNTIKIGKCWSKTYDGALPFAKSGTHNFAIMIINNKPVEVLDLKLVYDYLSETYNWSNKNIESSIDSENEVIVINDIFTIEKFRFENFVHVYKTK